MANLPERTGVVRDHKTGELILPATQRPDGTWRKARRVKDGYIPQEEVPAYETKGTQWAKSRPDYPIGLCPEDVEKTRQARAKIKHDYPVGLVGLPEDVERMKKGKGGESAETGSALSKSAKKNAKRKEKRKVQNAGGDASSLNSGMVNMKISAEKTQSSVESPLPPEEIAKKIKNLRKKLKQTEELEARINSGELKNPEKEQLEKIQRKQELITQIEDLELDLDD